MHIHHWDFTASDIWWAGLALFGCIAMAVFEALSFPPARRPMVAHARNRAHWE